MDELVAIRPGPLSRILTSLEGHDALLDALGRLTTLQRLTPGLLRDAVWLEPAMLHLLADAPEVDPADLPGEGPTCVTGLLHHPSVALIGLAAARIGIANQSFPALPRRVLGLALSLEPAERLFTDLGSPEPHPTRWSTRSDTASAARARQLARLFTLVERDAIRSHGHAPWIGQPPGWGIRSASLQGQSLLLEVDGDAEALVLRLPDTDEPVSVPVTRNEAGRVQVPIADGTPLWVSLVAPRSKRSLRALARKWRGLGAPDGVIPHTSGIGSMPGRGTLPIGRPPTLLDLHLLPVAGELEVHCTARNADRLVLRDLCGEREITSPPLPEGERATFRIPPPTDGPLLVTPHRGGMPGPSWRLPSPLRTTGATWTGQLRAPDRLGPASSFEVGVRGSDQRGARVRLMLGGQVLGVAALGEQAHWTLMLRSETDRWVLGASSPRGTLCYDVVVDPSEPLELTAEVVEHGPTQPSTVVRFRPLPIDRGAGPTEPRAPTLTWNAADHHVPGDVLELEVDGLLPGTVELVITDAYGEPWVRRSIDPTSHRCRLRWVLREQGGTLVLGDAEGPEVDLRTPPGFGRTLTARSTLIGGSGEVLASGTAPPIRILHPGARPVVLVAPEADLAVQGRLQDLLATLGVKVSAFVRPPSSLFADAPLPSRLHAIAQRTEGLDDALFIGVAPTEPEHHHGRVAVGPLAALDGLVDALLFNGPTEPTGPVVRVEVQRTPTGELELLPPAAGHGRPSVPATPSETVLGVDGPTYKVVPLTWATETTGHALLPAPEGTVAIDVLQGGHQVARWMRPPFAVDDSDSASPLCHTRRRLHWHDTVWTDLGPHEPPSSHTETWLTDGWTTATTDRPGQPVSSAPLRRTGRIRYVGAWQGAPLSRGRTAWIRFLADPGPHRLCCDGQTVMELGESSRIEVSWLDDTLQVHAGAGGSQPLPSVRGLRVERLGPAGEVLASVALPDLRLDRRTLVPIVCCRPAIVDGENIRRSTVEEAERTLRASFPGSDVRVLDHPAPPDALTLTTADSAGLLDALARESARTEGLGEAIWVAVLPGTMEVDMLGPSLGARACLVLGTSSRCPPLPDADVPTLGRTLRITGRLHRELHLDPPTVLGRTGVGCLPHTTPLRLRSLTQGGALLVERPVRARSAAPSHVEAEVPLSPEVALVELVHADRPLRRWRVDTDLGSTRLQRLHPTEALLGDTSGAWFQVPDRSWAHHAAHGLRAVEHSLQDSRFTSVAVPTTGLPLRAIRGGADRAYAIRPTPDLEGSWIDTVAWSSDQESGHSASFPAHPGVRVRATDPDRPGDALPAGPPRGEHPLSLRLTRPVAAFLPAACTVDSWSGCNERAMLEALESVHGGRLQLPGVRFPWTPAGLTVRETLPRTAEEAGPLLGALAEACRATTGLEDALWIAVVPGRQAWLRSEPAPGAWRVAAATVSGIRAFLGALVHQAAFWESPPATEAIDLCLHLDASGALTHTDVVHRFRPVLPASAGTYRLLGLASDGEPTSIPLHAWPGDAGGTLLTAIAPMPPGVRVYELLHGELHVARFHPAMHRRRAPFAVERAEADPDLHRWALPDGLRPTFQFVDAAVPLPGRTAWIPIHVLTGDARHSRLPRTWLTSPAALRVRARVGWSDQISTPIPWDGRPVIGRRAHPVGAHLVAVRDAPGTLDPDATWTEAGRHARGPRHPRTQPPPMLDGFVAHRPARPSAAKVTGVVLFRPTVWDVDAPRRCPLDDAHAGLHHTFGPTPIIELPSIADRLAFLERLPDDPHHPLVAPLLGALCHTAVVSPGGADHLWLLIVPGEGDWLATRTSSAARLVAVCPLGGLRRIPEVLADRERSAPRRTVLRVVGEVDAYSRVRLTDLRIEQRVLHAPPAVGNPLGIVLRHGYDHARPACPLELEFDTAIPQRFYGLVPCDEDLAGAALVHGGRVLARRMRGAGRVSPPNPTQTDGHYHWRLNEEGAPQLSTCIELEHGGIRTPVAHIRPPCDRWTPRPHRYGPWERLHVVVSDGFNSASGTVARGTDRPDPSRAILRATGNGLWLDLDGDTAPRIHWRTPDVELPVVPSGAHLGLPAHHLGDVRASFARPGAPDLLTLDGGGLPGTGPVHRLCSLGDHGLLVTGLDGRLHRMDRDGATLVHGEAPDPVHLQVGSTQIAWCPDGSTVLRADLSTDLPPESTRLAEGVHQLCVGSDATWIVDGEGQLWAWRGRSRPEAIDRHLPPILALRLPDAHGDVRLTLHHDALALEGGELSVRIPVQGGPPVDACLHAPDALLFATAEALWYARPFDTTVREVARLTADVVGMGPCAAGAWVASRHGEVHLFQSSSTEPKRIDIGHPIELVRQAPGADRLALVSLSGQTTILSLVGRPLLRREHARYPIGDAAWMGSELVLAPRPIVAHWPGRETRP